MPSRQQKSAKKGSKSYLIFGPNQILETLRLDDRRPDHENVCWWFLDRSNIITRSVKTKKQCVSLKMFEIKFKLTKLVNSVSESMKKQKTKQTNKKKTNKKKMKKSEKKNLNL